MAIPTLSYTPTPVEYAGFLGALAAANAPIIAQNTALAAQKPPGKSLPLLDGPGYFAQLVSGWMQSYASTHQAALLQQALANYPTLSAAVQLQVLTALGLPDLAKLPVATQLTVLGGLGAQTFLALPVAQQNQIFTLLGIGG